MNLWNESSVKAVSGKSDDMRLHTDGIRVNYPLCRQYWFSEVIFIFLSSEFDI